MGNKVAAKKCPYNVGVGCTDTSKCETCGFNPAVSKRRVHDLRVALGCNDVGEEHEQ